MAHNGLLERRTHGSPANIKFTNKAGYHRPIFTASWQIKGIELIIQKELVKNGGAKTPRTRGEGSINESLFIDHKNSGESVYQEPRASDQKVLHPREPC